VLESQGKFVMEFFGQSGLLDMGESILLSNIAGGGGLCCVLYFCFEKFLAAMALYLGMVTVRKEKEECTTIETMFSRLHVHLSDYFLIFGNHITVNRVVQQRVIDASSCIIGKGDPQVESSLICIFNKACLFLRTNPISIHGKWAAFESGGNWKSLVCATLICYARTPKKI
jgi:hypothetical protein